MKEIVVSNWGKTATIYSDRMCCDVVQFCAKGKTLTAFAAFTGIHLSTLKKWRAVHPEFKSACEAAKEAQLAYMEHLALGQVDGTVKGSTTALMFLLKNQFKDQYKDKVEVEHGGELNFIVSTGIRRTPVEDKTESGVVEVESKVVETDTDYL